MDTKPQTEDSERLSWAHVVPFAVFMAFMILLQLMGGFIQWKHPDAPWWRQDPAQFIYPLQTIAAGIALFHYRRYYTFNWSWKWGVIGFIFGAIGIACWLLPTTLHQVWGLTEDPGGWLGRLGVAERKEGFDPGIFHNPVSYWAALIMRFIRAAVIVALVEEIFWRGFLMRFICDWDGDYWKQPFGRPHWLSYVIVTGLFIAAHAPVDHAGAFVYGTLTYLLCVWSKNLGACVIMHAAANFLMGIYIMQTGKYGLW